MGATELAGAILARSSFFVEYPQQTRIEGENQNLPPDYPVTALRKVIAGRAEGRTDVAQVILFDSVDCATADFSALRYVHSKLAGQSFSEDLDLIDDPDELRDLFGMPLRYKPL